MASVDVAVIQVQPSPYWASIQQIFCVARHELNTRRHRHDTVIEDGCHNENFSNQAIEQLSLFTDYTEGVIAPGAEIAASWHSRTPRIIVRGINVRIEGVHGCPTIITTTVQIKYVRAIGLLELVDGHQTCMARLKSARLDALNVVTLSSSMKVQISLSPSECLYSWHWPTVRTPDIGTN